MQIGDYVRVQDSVTGTILIAGKITKATDNPKGYSVDGKLFFNPNSTKFKIEKLDFEVRNLYFTGCSSNKYIHFRDNNLDNTFEYDFFEWNDIEPEVIEICELLNQIPGIETYSSCSGHGIISPWVDFYINDEKSFYDLLDFLRDNDQPSKTDKHNDIKSKHRFIIGVEGRGTCHLESLEINSKFEDLCRVLKKYIIRI